MQNRKGNSPIIVRSHDVYLDSDYVQWIHDIKERFSSFEGKFRTVVIQLATGTGSCFTEVRRKMGTWYC